MPSHSLIRWQGERGAALDEIESAHVRVGGAKRGRRHATRQLNRAYAVLLASEFQGFCRDLYSECVEHVVAATATNLQDLFRTQLRWGDPLNRGNPHAAEIGSQFGRFGPPFWEGVYAAHPLNGRRKAMLDELMKWRNAIAHNDYDPNKLGSGIVLHVRQVRRWRSALNGLCDGFDRVLRERLAVVVGTPPWQA